MSDWFSKLTFDGRNMVEANRAKKSWTGIRNSIVDKYPDPVHFIYELLQNADDQGATKASFTLTPKSLIFQHNGDPFTQEDVEHITEIGNSEKLEQGNKIGRYGIGFKSVYSVTECPQVFTFLDGQPFAFQIEDLVIPEALEVNADHPTDLETRFVLPFSDAKAELLSDQLARKLRTLGADTMMFLNHLRQISWQVEWETGTYVCERPNNQNGDCHLTSKVFLHGVTSQHDKAQYLLFSRSVEGEGDRNNLSVCIAFRLDDGRVVEETANSCLNVYFPTRKETRLKFRLHAPMLLTPDRANIREDDTNTLLIKECAALLADTLPKLRGMGKLTGECLQCLPIRPQDFPDKSFFRPMYTAVRDLLRSNEPLLPTRAGSPCGHVTVQYGRISNTTPVRELLADDGQINKLEGQSLSSPVCWLSEKFQQYATHDTWAYLKEELRVVELDNKRFVGLLDKPFLQSQSDEWMVRFYTMMLENTSHWEKGKSDPRLRRVAIIRLEDGGHAVPFDERDNPQVFLPLLIREQWEVACVRGIIADDPKALEFLQRLGLHKPDVVDQVMTKILPRYQSNNPLNYDLSEYKKDIALIGEAAEEALHGAYSPTKRGALDARMKQSAFILSVNTATGTKALLQPKDVKQPTDELLQWFEGNPHVWFVSSDLITSQGWKAINNFLNRQTKITDTLVLRTTPPEKNGYVETDSKKPYIRGINRFDPNADIDGLVHAMRNPTRERARLLWNMLCNYTHLLIGEVETSNMKNFVPCERDRQSSKIYDACHNVAWLPDTDGAFHVPHALSLHDLPHDFEKSSNAKLLAHNLGMKQNEVSEEDRFAKKYKLPPHFFTLLKERPDEAQKWAAQMQFATFSGGESASSTRLEKTVIQQQSTPQMRYEKKLRSVRVSSPDIQEQDKERLRMRYEVEGRMQCQICLQASAFKVNGQDYFEAVQCVRQKETADYSPQELISNRLALCPTCAAKYLYANSYKDTEALRQAILNLKGNELSIVLADKEHTIHFKHKHLDELKAVLRVTKPDNNKVAL